jgi:hypothetical protein
MEKAMFFTVFDGGEKYIYPDIESALEYIQQEVLEIQHQGSMPKDIEYRIEIIYMTQAEYAALPVE